MNGGVVVGVDRFAISTRPGVFRSPPRFAELPARTAGSENNKTENNKTENNKTDTLLAAEVGRASPFLPVCEISAVFPGSLKEPDSRPRSAVDRPHHFQ
jgi:hypothetical protein